MKYLILLVSIVSVISCTEKKTLTEAIETGSVSSIDMSLECACDELIADSTGKFIYNDSLFTGTCHSNYPETDLKYVKKSYWKGLLHGEITYYDKDGEVLAQEEYSEGINTKSATDKFIACGCSELVKKPGLGGVPDQSYRGNALFTGICYEYYPDSENIYLESTYRDGVKHGPTRFFDKEGTELFMEEYKGGELISTVRPD